MAQTVGRTAGISTGPGDLWLSFRVEGLAFTQLVPCKAGKMSNSKKKITGQLLEQGLYLQLTGKVDGKLS